MNEAKTARKTSQPFTIYNLQFTIYYLQFTIYNLQFTVYNLHFTIYNALKIGAMNDGKTASKSWEQLCTPSFSQS